VTDDQILTPSYIVHITDTTTGETRVVRMTGTFGHDEDFWWHEGDASCDCNRGAWFHGGGRTEKRPCGEGRYRVRCVNDAGRVLYEDMEDSVSDRQANGQVFAMLGPNDEVLVASRHPECEAMEFALADLFLLPPHVRQRFVDAMRWLKSDPDFHAPSDPTHTVTLRDFDCDGYRLRWCTLLLPSEP
jgi:hypothetical protein